jgi:methionyl aminopeptidase
VLAAEVRIIYEFWRRPHHPQVAGRDREDEAEREDGPPARRDHDGPGKGRRKKIAELGAKPAFKGYYDYPCVLCTSINEEIVHGIPSEKRVLKAGDIVSIDCGVVLDGYYGDAAITVPVGESLKPELKKLLEVTEASLYKGIEQARSATRSGDVGAASRSMWKRTASAWCASLWDTASGRSCTKRRRFRITGRAARARKLREGMVLAIEPMVNSGKPGDAGAWRQVDGRNADGSYSAHFEHCVAVTKDGPVILTQ